MTDQHPLTEATAAELWDAGQGPECNLVDRYEEMGQEEWAIVGAALRAAFDAGREHEHEREHAAQDRPAEITDEMVEVAVRTWLGTAAGTAKRSMRAALSAALAVATPADPHHDPRPWQDCTREDIRKGDLVGSRVRGVLRVAVAHHQNKNGDWLTEGGDLLTYGPNYPLRRIPAHTTEKETPMPERTTPAEPLARTLLGVPEGHGAPHHDGGQIKPGDYVAQVDESGFIRAGRAHYQDEKGDWWSKSGACITWAAQRADRPDALTIWPAPTPPAEEVELPTAHPAHLTDVEDVVGNVCAYMALDHDGDWCGVSRQGLFCGWRPHELAAFTLPDGTRARRDGAREDGTPRFVKVEADQ